MGTLLAYWRRQIARFEAALDGERGPLYLKVYRYLVRRYEGLVLGEPADLPSAVASAGPELASPRPFRSPERIRELLLRIRG
ncbi:MAG TPA: hypothetical protein VF950_30810 [Planctomycetota bacterium]